MILIVDWFDHELKCFVSRTFEMIYRTKRKTRHKLFVLLAVVNA